MNAHQLQRGRSGTQGPKGSGRFRCARTNSCVTIDEPEPNPHFPTDGGATKNVHFWSQVQASPKLQSFVHKCAYASTAAPEAEKPAQRRQTMALPALRPKKDTRAYFRHAQTENLVGFNYNTRSTFLHQVKGIFSKSYQNVASKYQLESAFMISCL